jgi:hypothetical protein
MKVSITIETNHAKKKSFETLVTIKTPNNIRVGWTKPARTNQALIFTWNLLLIKGSNTWRM